MSIITVDELGVLQERVEGSQDYSLGIKFRRLKTALYLVGLLDDLELLELAGIGGAVDTAAMASLLALLSEAEPLFAEFPQNTTSEEDAQAALSDCLARLSRTAR